MLLLPFCFSYTFRGNLDRRSSLLRSRFDLSLALLFPLTDPAFSLATQNVGTSSYRRLSRIIADASNLLLFAGRKLVEHEIPPVAVDDDDDDEDDDDQQRDI